jgi:hypothetical protein
LSSPLDEDTIMTRGDNSAAPSAYRPGEAVWVFVLGTWQPAIVVSTEDSGHVLARYRRFDGELAERSFPQSSVVEGSAL